MVPYWYGTRMTPASTRYDTRAHGYMVYYKTQPQTRHFSVTRRAVMGVPVLLTLATMEALDDEDGRLEAEGL